MDETSKEVFNHKKMALMKGDDAVVHQIGEGNDIISILSKSCSYQDCDFFKIPFVDWFVSRNSAIKYGC